MYQRAQEAKKEGRCRERLPKVPLLCTSLNLFDKSATVFRHFQTSKKVGKLIERSKRLCRNNGDNLFAKNKWRVVFWGYSIQTLVQYLLSINTGERIHFNQGRILSFKAPYVMKILGSLSHLQFNTLYSMKKMNSPELFSVQ